MGNNEFFWSGLNNDNGNVCRYLYCKLVYQADDKGTGECFLE